MINQGNITKVNSLKSPLDSATGAALFLSPQLQYLFGKSGASERLSTA